MSLLALSTNANYTVTYSYCVYPLFFQTLTYIPCISIMHWSLLLIRVILTHACSIGSSEGAWVPGAQRLFALISYTLQSYIRKALFEDFLKDWIFKFDNIFFFPRHLTLVSYDSKRHIDSAAWTWIRSILRCLYTHTLPCAVFFSYSGTILPGGKAWFFKARLGKLWGRKRRTRWVTRCSF